MKLTTYQTGRGHVVSAKEKKAYQAFMDVMGDNGLCWMTKPVAGDVAREIVRKLTEKLSEA